MGAIDADEELLLSKWHIIGEGDVKRMHLRVLVDTGAYMLTINESIRDYLQKPLLERRNAVLAGDVEPFLGVIPMEEMDVLIHPQREEFIVNPGIPFLPLEIEILVKGRLVLFKSLPLSIRFHRFSFHPKINPVIKNG